MNCKYRMTNYKLKELGRIITGKTPSSKESGVISDCESDYLFVTPRDMNQQEKEITATERYITNKVSSSFDKIILKGQSICVSCIGTIGKVFKVTSPAITNQQINSITDINQEKCNPDYLYYLLSTMTEEIENLAGGTTMPIVNKTAFESLEVELPELSEQNRVAEILSRIDDKIASNNRTNDNLHEMCLTIYRDLINKADAEKDLLKNHAKCVLGGTPSRAKPEYWNGNINWINSGEINRFRILEPSETITDLGLQKTSTTLLPIGTTVLAITGATLGQVSRLEIESCANQSVIGVIPDDSLTNEFVYLNILENINDIIGRQTGGAQQHINKNDVETYEIIIPGPEKIAKFDKEIKPIFGQIRNNCLENERLTKLRDTLLPELLNGKIDVSNIDT